jgi:hypothetical protein
MPKCFGCEKSVDPYDLEQVGDDLFCSSCRELRSEPARAEEPKKEVTMSKNERKPIASIQVFEGEEDNYEIEGYVRIGGIKLEIDTDVNRVRDFFTKRRESRLKRAAEKPRHLRSVQEE